MVPECAPVPMMFIVQLSAHNEEIHENKLITLCRHEPVALTHISDAIRSVSIWGHSTYYILISFHKFMWKGNKYWTSYSFFILCRNKILDVTRYNSKYGCYTYYYNRKKTGGTKYKRHIVAHTGSFQFSTLMKYDVISTAKAVFMGDEEE